MLYFIYKAACFLETIEGIYNLGSLSCYLGDKQYTRLATAENADSKHPSLKIGAFRKRLHYNDAIMDEMASQITRLNHCLLNRLFRRRLKKTSKPRVTGLCAANSPVTGEFPALMTSYAEDVSIWWRHHEVS